MVFFGDNTETGTSSEGSESKHLLYYCQYDGASTGTVQSMSAYFLTDTKLYSGMALIFDSDEKLWCKSDEKKAIPVSDPNFSWVEFTFSNPSSLTVGAYYYLGVWMKNNAGADCLLHRIAAGTPGACFSSATDLFDANPPSDISNVIRDARSTSESYQIYCTYTTAAAGTTSFNTMSGSATNWIWAKTSTTAGKAPRSKTADSLGWDWGTVTGDSSTYIPSGNPLNWGWCLENK